MNPGRLRCARCLRPQSTCLCGWITETPTQCEVLILQHPLEVDQAKGSARLLHLSLPGSRLLVGEAFEPESLQALLDADQRVNVLLYPGDGGTPPAPAAPQDPARLRLVVLDGTWRKSRKMLHLNPPLQRLPRLALQPLAPSAYRIRKAHRPEQLSTLEATCQALSQLETRAAPGHFKPLLDAFDTFVASRLR